MNFRMNLLLKMLQRKQKKVEKEDTAENEDILENEDQSVVEKILNVEEVNDNVIESADGTRHNLNNEHRKIVERLNEIMLEGEC